MLTFPCVKAQKAAIAGLEVSASDVSSRAVDSVVVEVGGHPAEEEREDVVCGEVEPGAVEGANLWIRLEAGPELWHNCGTLALGRFCTLSKPVSVHNNVTAFGKVILPRALWYCLNCYLSVATIRRSRAFAGQLLL